MNASRAFALDHVVIAVEALATAGALFASAGLPAAGGGRHHGLPTENSLFALGDGAYGELLALHERGLRAQLRGRHAEGGLAAWLASRTAIERRFLPGFVHADGISDLVLRAPGRDDADDDAFDAALARLRAAGIAFEGPAPMGRTRPDGVALAWRLALPASRALPFLIADDTPTALRVPAPGAGPVPPRVQRVIVAVHDLAASVRAWKLLLGDTLVGATLPRDTLPREAVAAPAFAVGATQLELREVGRESREGACGIQLAGRAPAPPVATALAALGVTFA